MAFVDDSSRWLPPSARFIFSGSGGSLPLVAVLADAYPDMALLLTGVDDPQSKAHSENESVHLGELQKCCVNEAILLGYLAAEVR